MSAYYNEHDKFAAAWLRELIKEGLIADGEVDERDIQDVSADDVRGFTQCHWFAGIGGWSYALRLAGWPDDGPVWTGSCPCQPFSAAGTQKGGADHRHLWPHWARLIRECRPVTVFGEQVESAIAHGWLDAVFDDLEREGYACGAACVPAAGVGAPHIRQRVWFVADANGEREGAISGVQAHRGQSAGSFIMADSDRGRQCERGERDSDTPQREQPASQRHDVSGRCDLGHTSSGGQRVNGRSPRGGASPWADLIWLPCRDGKARPTQPGLQPMAHGVSARVGRLRGYGNAIVPQAAAAFIEACLSVRED